MTVVDRAELGSGAARGNAGFFSPTLMAPLPGPGMLRQAARAARRPQTVRCASGRVPFRRCWAGASASSGRRTSARFEAGRAALAALNRDLDDLLAELGSLGVDVSLGRDIVVPFHDAALAERFHAELRRMGPLGAGVPGEMLDGDGVRRVVPALTDHVRAGFVLPGNRAADPRRYVDSPDRRPRSRETSRCSSIARSAGFDVTGDRVRPGPHERWDPRRRRGGPRRRSGDPLRRPAARAPRSRWSPVRATTSRSPTSAAARAPGHRGGGPRGGDAVRRSHPARWHHGARR